MGYEVSWRKQSNCKSTGIAITVKDKKKRRKKRRMEERRGEKKKQKKKLSQASNFPQ